jgi:hypothetical protein
MGSNRIGDRIGVLSNPAGDRKKKECRNFAKASPSADTGNGAMTPNPTT